MGKGLCARGFIQKKSLSARALEEYGDGSRTLLLLQVLLLQVFYLNKCRFLLEYPNSKKRN